MARYGIRGYEGTTEEGIRQPRQAHRAPRVRTLVALAHFDTVTSCIIPTSGGSRIWGFNMSILILHGHLRHAWLHWQQCSLGYNAYSRRSNAELKLSAWYCTTVSSISED